jgi:hypothetical protein
LRIVQATHAEDTVTGAHGCLLWLDLSDRPDVVDIACVLRDDPDLRLSSSWNFELESTPALTLQVRVVTPIECRFHIGFDPESRYEFDVIREIVDRGQLGIMLGIWHEGDLVQNHTVIELPAHSTDLAALLDGMFVGPVAE